MQESAVENLSLVRGRWLCAALMIISVLGIGSFSGWHSSAAAGACSLDGFDSRRTVGGRTYELHVPSGLAGPSVPLVLSLHGLGQTGARHAADSGWAAHADANGYIVAFPDGRWRSWNYSQYGAGDVAWLRAVVADVGAAWCVDPSRVHVAGHSNGAFMAQRLACDAADVFASAASYAGGNPDVTGHACAPSRGIGVALFQGDADFVVPSQWAAVARDGWVDRLQCATPPESDPVADGGLLRYVGCRDGVQVIWRTYPGQSHLWPTGARRQDMLDTMWAFFGAHHKP